jgi:prepilin-type processing-associated H-X9-DG protein
MTTYLGVGGPRGMLTKPEPAAAMAGIPSRGLSFASVTDGLSNTLMIVEAGDELAVEWTRPQEFVPDAKNPLKGLLGLHPGGFNAGFADGSVRFISQAIDLKVLMNLFERDDGNVIPEF